MNPAILLVDVASANREELKSFLQAQKRDGARCRDRGQVLPSDTTRLGSPVRYLIGYR
jgi:hypothetical protein